MTLQVLHVIGTHQSWKWWKANFRAFDSLKDWEWMKLIYKIKPLVEQRDNAKEIKAMQEEFKENKEKLEKETKMREELQDSFWSVFYCLISVTTDTYEFSRKFD